MTTVKKWEIIHIPEKSPTLTEEPPCVDVIAAVIEPKSANTLVRRLSQIVPLENLFHVKRVRKSSAEGGEIQLTIILCLANEDEPPLESIPSDIQELVNAYQLSPFIAKVVKYAASSKEEWKEQCKLWPTSYHPPVYNIEGITGFSEEDSKSVFYFMRLTLELAKSRPQVVNAATIVDPSHAQIISSAADQTQTHDNSVNNITLETCNVEPYMSVSCLYPWTWTELRPQTNSIHPLRHAALVAIEYAASRDKDLYPPSGDLQDPSCQVDHPSPSSSSPAKKQKTDIANGWGSGLITCSSNGSHCKTERPYLCTGFDIYLAWEPCTMCAMALVHQRIRRIFYAFPNPNCGALGSVYRLQGEKSLNHHYAVFRVLLPEEELHI